MNEQSEFWSSVAGRYDSVIDLQVGADTRWRVRERILADERRFGNAAEFGCGTGFFTDAIASRAESVMAVDIAPGMLAVARARCKGRNISFRQEDCQRTSLAEGSLDSAFLSLVIHFTDPTTTLKEMWRVLKPRGMLAVLNVDPLALDGLRLFCAKVRILYYGITRYRVKPPKNFSKNLIAAEDLSELMARTGFGIVSVESFRSSSRFSDVPIELIQATKAEHLV